MTSDDLKDALDMLFRVYDNCYSCDFCGIVGHPGQSGHKSDCELRLFLYKNRRIP